jgi:hypothetical protein
MRRKLDVLPCRSWSGLSSGADCIPRCCAEIGMPGGVLASLQYAGRDFGLKEIGDGIVARLEEQEGIFAVGDPGSTEAYAHTAA